ncbi:MAG: tetratricopeptide repeat protein [Planctomycetota bacterium]|nr:tetratricopeptide repeat protein [Planctomycetota bacterium]
MRLLLLFAIVAVGTLVPPVQAQDDAASSPARGSLIEDRAAHKLVEAGDARLEADEPAKAVEVWQSVIERYPTSRVRFLAHMRLGNYFLERDRAFEKARVQFESVVTEENREEEQRAEATLKMGVCFYEARNFGKSFQVMRDVIEKFPVSQHVNQAYYYIGLGHFQLGHYSRAIAALEKVGTALSGEDQQVHKVEAGKRLFIKIEDADLAALESGEAVKVECQAASGDKEIVDCFPVGRNVRIVLGSITTQLGRPRPGNGSLEVKGDDQVSVTYIDQHTADKQFDRKLLHEVTVVGDGIVSITDGAFSETLQGVVLGKTVNIQTSDPDRDLTDEADQLSAFVEVYRAKTDEELEAEAIAAVNAAGGAVANATPVPGDEEAKEIDRFKLVDRAEVRFVEALVESQAASLDGAAIPVDATATTDADPAAATVPAAVGAGEPADTSVHSGIFRASIQLARADEAITGDDTLQALPGDIVRVVYQDDKNTTDSSREVRVDAKCIEGNLGGVRVTRSQIADRELRVKTRLKTADALTNIGNRYKEFGLKDNARGKYDQALVLCEEIMTEARQLGGRLLEETYVQLWQIYFEMDRLELAAAMAEQLQREFPNSGFVDDALLQLAEVARKQGDLNRAIGVYSRLVNMQTSQLRGEAQFGIAECYGAMADATTGPQATQLYDRAFQEYKKVFDQFPESGRVGEAVAQMANYYYRQQDYARAVDTFETVLTNYPDAKFLDVILFNYGRCLYRMDRKGEARRRFDQLIADYPESTLAADAKKISEALTTAGG